MVKVYMDVLKKEFSFEELVEIIRVLRAPGGCPWDAEQTHKSIRNAFIEETYEAVDAIDRADKADLCEELGDVLLQILLHSQIAKEEGEFDINAVISGEAQKMILRHPHVFSDVKVESTAEVLDNWEKIKHIEKHQTNAAQTLKSVPACFPALMYSQKVQKRAFKAGADKPEHSHLIKRAEELFKCIQEGKNEGYGELLFIIAGLAQANGTDCEEALYKQTASFIEKFEAAENSPQGIKDVFKRETVE